MVSHRRTGSIVAGGETLELEREGISINTQSKTVPGPPEIPSPQADSSASLLRKAWLSIRGRILAGLVTLVPLAVTIWVFSWGYTLLERHVIGPLGQWVLWKIRLGQPDTELPFWFEQYAAPLIAIVLALALLYVVGFFAHTGLRRAVDGLVRRVPVISIVYKGVQQVLQTLDKPQGQPRPQRVVLVPFPHPGTKVPAFVTGMCRDVETQKTILCVYVPTTPVPTSGYMLLVPEEEVVELTWTSEEALQTIISGGLTVPPEVRYYKPGVTLTIESAPGRARET
jgi:uncharacterized membrane protein